MLTSSLMMGLHARPWTSRSFLLPLLPITLWQAGRWLYKWRNMSDLERRAKPLPLAPYALPILGNTLGMMWHTSDFLEALVQVTEYFQGRPHGLKIVGLPTGVFVSSPELFEDVLKTQFDCFDKGPHFRDVLGDSLGQGIFAVDGTKWSHQRKIASALFTTNALRDCMDSAVKKRIPLLCEVLQRGANSGSPVPVNQLMHRFTMDAFADFGFGVNLHCLTRGEDHPFARALERVQATSFLRFTRPGWIWRTMRWLNIGRERELKDSVRVVDNLIYSIIAEAMELQHRPAAATAKKKVDVVSLYLERMKKDPTMEFDPVGLRDLVVNLLVAGRDTTAQAFSWCFYELSQHPEIVEKLRAELKDKLPGLVSGQIMAPTMDQVAPLAYLEAIVKETMRLYPGVPTNIKQANRDTVLSDGTFVKAGSTVTLAAYAMGRLESVWGPDAKQFNPERWIDPETGKVKRVSAYKFSTFGAGPRKCIGMHMSMTELKIVLASVLTKFDFELEPGSVVTYKPSVTLSMKHELYMRVTPV